MPARGSAPVTFGDASPADTAVVDDEGGAAAEDGCSGSDIARVGSWPSADPAGVAIAVEPPDTTNCSRAPRSLAMSPDDSSAVVRPNGQSSSRASTGIVPGAPASSVREIRNSATRETANARQG